MIWASGLSSEVSADSNIGWILKSFENIPGLLRFTISTVLNHDFFSQPDLGLKSESRKSVKFIEKSDLSEFSNLWRSEMLWTSLVTATCLLKQKRLKYHHFSFSHHLFLFTKCLFLCKVMGCHLLAKVHTFRLT